MVLMVFPSIHFIVVFFLGVGFFEATTVGFADGDGVGVGFAKFNPNFAKFTSIFFL